jgi:hypothetical protein
MESTLILAVLFQEWQPFYARREPAALQPLITLRPRSGLPMVLRRRQPESDATPSEGIRP